MSKHFPFTLLSLACALLFSVNCRATIQQVSGGVGTNATWNTDTVQVVGDVLIAVGCTLTIDPGTLVEFMGYYSFQSSGTIRANGVVNDSIRFTHYDSTGLSNQTNTNGGWSGFYVQNTNVWLAISDSSIFDYCVFEYMKEGPGWNAGNLTWVNSSRVRFSNCEFRYNYQPHYRAALYAIDSSCFLVKRCYFHDNHGATGGGITMFDGSSLTIEWCTFYNNYVEYTGGAIHAQNNCSPRIMNNFICNNSTKPSNCGPADGGGGIRLIYGGNSYVANNIIANNLSGIHGGGIECLWGATATLEHNTIVNNSSQGYGAGLFIQESNVTLKNNIFWGNRAFGSLNYEIDYFSADSITVFTGDVVNNCIEGDTAALMFTQWFTYGGSIYYNFDSLPQFVAPSAGIGTAFNGMAADWTLQSSSDCINRAFGGVSPLMPNKDVYGNPRLSGWQYDVGAYEDPTALGIQENAQTSFEVFPNPCTDHFTISGSNFATNELVVVKIFDATGKLVLTTSQLPNEEVYLPSTCEAGIYCVVLTVGENSSSTTLIRQ